MTIWWYDNVQDAACSIRSTVVQVYNWVRFGGRIAIPIKFYLAATKTKDVLDILATGPDKSFYKDGDVSLKS